MGTQRKKYDGDAYLQQYPHLLRWVNVCPACGAKGHRPELPENIYPQFSVAAQNLRRFFTPLALDEQGLCEQCSEAVRQR